MKKVQVIIPTRNRRELLIEVLALLKKQTYPISKVIVVDSSDVFMKLENFDSIEISHIYSPIRSTAYQRNLGLQNVDEDTYSACFLDDDVTFESNYVEALLLMLSDKIGRAHV